MCDHSKKTKRKKKFALSDDDVQLWKSYTKTIDPIKKNQYEDVSFEYYIEEPQPDFEITFKKKTPYPKKENKNKQTQPEELDKRFDRKTEKNIRRGTLDIEATLDLHGDSQEKAFLRLQNFIQSQYNKGKRWILVITGKGAGILRSQLPNWLEHKSIRPMVLSYKVSHIKHGGEGAFYVCLKRKKE